jgi:hypothetical protein
MSGDEAISGLADTVRHDVPDVNQIHSDTRSTANASLSASAPIPMMSQNRLAAGDYFGSFMRTSVVNRLKSE